MPISFGSTGAVIVVSVLPVGGIIYTDPVLTYPSIADLAQLGQGHAL